MPGEISQDAAADLTTCVWHGTIALGAINEAIAKVQALPQTRHSLWDFSQADGVKLTGDELRGLIRAAAETRPERQKVAMTAVIVKDDLQFGLGRQAQTYIDLEADMPKLGVFRDRSSAYTWLGVQATPSRDKEGTAGEGSG